MHDIKKKIPVRSDSLYKKYNKIIIPNEDKIEEIDDYYCPSCHLDNDKKGSIGKSGGLGWPIDRDYNNRTTQKGQNESVNIKFNNYNEIGIAYSILTTHLNDFEYSPIFIEDSTSGGAMDFIVLMTIKIMEQRMYDLVNNPVIRQLRNAEEIIQTRGNEIQTSTDFFDFCYRGNENAFEKFDGDSMILYHNAPLQQLEQLGVSQQFLNHPNIKSCIEQISKVENFQGGVLHGNVWIKLQGSRECDFAEADKVASEAGLFGYRLAGNKNTGYYPYPKSRPKNYTWHHVYMGWFDYEKALENIANFISLSFNSDDTVGILNFFSTTQIIKILFANGLQNAIFFHGQNLDINMFDASGWEGGLIKWDGMPWNPTQNYCLMQLVNTDIHKFCGAHSGAVEQYKEYYFDHIYCKGNVHDTSDKRCYC